MNVFHPEKYKRDKFIDRDLQIQTTINLDESAIHR